MAKPNPSDPKAVTAARIQRTESYAEKVRQLFAATVNEILALNKTMPDVANGVMYSFDGDTKKVQAKVEYLLRRLHSAATMAIERGIVLEWEKANEECDKLVNSMYGQALMSNPTFKGWTERNNAARDAFIRRSDKGMNLSSRVWRDVRMLRDEMEVAITVAVGQGEDAGSISRQVRQYLNDPDLMFRRFQYHEKEPVLDDEGNPVLDKHGKPKLQDKLGKDGKPIVRKKWKKRIADPNNPGKYKWIDYDRDSYVPYGAGENSRGVYKSAAKNAMRLARTETNIAYRRADHERWKQMDFVLGIRIQVSKNHLEKMPKGDICDKLAGDYPKDFVFDGWHPQCFCFATPILPDTEEMIKMAEAHDQGKKYTPKGIIRDYPQGFKDWVQENEDKICDPNLSNPYFITNNERDIVKILKGEEFEPEPLTPQEIAEIRHQNRTPEQIADIQARWDARNAEREAEAQAAAKLQRDNEATQRYGSRMLDIMDGIDGVDTSALKNAMDSGDFAAIMAEAQALKAIGKQFKQTANNVLSKAGEYGEVDDAALRDAIKSGNIASIRTETKALAQQILAQKKFEQSISDLIPDAHDWHTQFTAAELQGTYDAVKKKIAEIEAKFPGDKAKQAEKLEWEAITFLGGNMKGVQSKYATWKVSQAAYLKRAAELREEIFWDDAEKPIKAAEAFIISSGTKSKQIHDLIDKVKVAIASKNKSAWMLAAAELDNKRQALEKNFATRAAKKGGAAGGTVVFKDADFSATRKKNALLCSDKYEGETEFFDNAVGTYKGATRDMKAAAESYTRASGSITKMLRGMDGFHERDLSYADRSMREIDALTAMIRGRVLDRDVWLMRDERLAFLKLKAGGFDFDALESQFYEYRRKLEAKYNRKYGAKASSMRAEIDAKCEAYQLWRERNVVGCHGIDPSFLSCGSNEEHHFSGTGGDCPDGFTPKVRMKLFCPKGTQLIYAAPFNHYNSKHTDSSGYWDGTTHTISIHEAEVILQRGGEYRILEAHFERDTYSGQMRWFVTAELIAQRYTETDGYEYISGQGYKTKFK